MDDVFNEFIEKAKKLGLCQEYTDKVDHALSKKAYMSIALDANGVSWVSESIAKKWGLTPNYISENFAPFLNGRYVFHGDGYTSAMYCLTDKIDVHTTVASIIACNGEVHSDRTCELHITNSNVIISGSGRCVVHLYNSKIQNLDSFKGTIVEDNNYGKV